MDAVAKLNVAFKTIEILGRISRNYYRSIEATEKYLLTPKVVAERLGHSNTKMTMDIYSHVTSNMQREASLRFENLKPGYYSFLESPDGLSIT